MAASLFGASEAVAAPTCFGKQATKVGTNGDDRITGTDGVDVIFGSAGDDEIQSLKGEDLVCAGDGHDRINGGPQNDKLAGGDGNDRIESESRAVRSAGVTEIFGGDGTDTLLGSAIVTETFRPGPGNDVIHGGSSTSGGGKLDDTLDYTNASGPIIADLPSRKVTGEGTDSIRKIEDVKGSPAADQITGNGSDNGFDGGAGNDRIVGAGGADHITPGQVTTRSTVEAGRTRCSSTAPQTR
jgi:Ca2+-binding RTX toxin-like protein